MLPIRLARDISPAEWPESNDNGVVHTPSLAECFAHTDLEWRIHATPSEWACRGVFFNMLDERAGQLGAATQSAYRNFFRLYRFSPFKLYPVRDYLTRLVLVAQIQYGAPHIYEGIKEIQKSAFSSWRRTLMGRAAFAVFGNDFDMLLSGIERGYGTRTATNHSSMRLERPASGEYLVHFENEPNYIEHAMTGALLGVAAMAGVEVSMEHTLRDPFNGYVRLRVVTR